MPAGAHSYIETKQVGSGDTHSCKPVKYKTLPVKAALVRCPCYVAMTHPGLQKNDRLLAHLQIELEIVVKMWSVVRKALLFQTIRKGTGFLSFWTISPYNLAHTPFSFTFAVRKHSSTTAVFGQV